MVTIVTSTIADGSMKSLDKSYQSVLPARTAFLAKHDIRPDDTTLVHLVYEGADYLRYQTLDDDARGDGITQPASFIADGMVVTKPGHALFLPLADCVGAVIHDPVKNLLMLTHLGRHNLEQHGGNKSVEYLIHEFDSDPKQLIVWLSPAAGKVKYPLFAFDNRSLHDVTIEQLVAAGISPDNITASPIDTTSDENYFSHSEFLQGHRKTDGRFAVVCVMR